MKSARRKLRRVAGNARREDPVRRRKAILLATLVLLGLLAYFLGLQLLTDRLAGVDGFYHIRYAELLRQNGFSGAPFQAFPWMQVSIFQDGWVDHQMLFHVLLIPFTFGNLLLGAKMAAGTFAALALFSFYLLLRALKIRGSILWTLLLLGGSWSFLYRISMPRTQSLSLIFLLVVVYALIERRPRLLAATAFGFVWLYHFSMILFAIFFIAALTDLIYKRRIDRKLIASGVGGLVAGLVINPYFPKNLSFLYSHVVVKVLNHQGLPVGGEWGAFDSWFLVKVAAPVFALYLLAVAATFLDGREKGKRLDRQSFFLFLTSLLFLVLVMRSRKFIEYWPPFGLLFAASAMDPYLERIRNGSLRLPWRRVVLMATVVAGVALASINFRNCLGDISGNAPPKQYRDAAAWLENNTPPQSTIFTTDWDDFAELFFYNPNNNYLVGLDPTFMYLYDPVRYNKWSRVSTGQLSGIASIVTADFGSRYIFTDNHHGPFLARAKEDPLLNCVYRDSVCSIFEVGRSSPGNILVEAETEYPPPSHNGRRSRIQNVYEGFGIRCSNDLHLLYEAVTPGDYVELPVRVPADGTYDLTVGHLQSTDYGVFQISVDGLSVGEPLDAYAPSVAFSGVRKLSALQLSRGSHTLRFEVVGRSPQSTGFFMGIDFVALTRLKPPAEA